MVGDSVQGMTARGSDGLRKGLITDTVVEFRVRGERWKSAHFVKYLLRKKYLMSSFRIGAMVNFFICILGKINHDKRP